MFKYVSVFVCVLGVSLASGLSGLSDSKKAELTELLESVKTNREYFDLCEDVIGQKVKSCGDLLDDLATLETDVTGAVAEAWSIYDQGTTLMTEFTSCSTKSILKQVACYEKVFAATKTLIATAQTEIATFQEELLTDVSTLESDLQSCVYSGYTSQLLNTEVSVCKLSLLQKN